MSRRPAHALSDSGSFERRAAGRWPAVPAVLVGLLGLVMTTALCTWSLRNDRAERRALAEQQVEAFVQALGSQTQAYVDTLPGLRLFGALRGPASDAEFNAQVEALSPPRRYPGLALITAADLVRGPELAAYLATVRADRSQRAAGHPGLDPQPPGERPLYLLLRHSVPPEPALLGQDLLHSGQPDRAAIETAIDSGELVATGPLLAGPAQPADRTSVVVRAASYGPGAPPATASARRAAVRGVVGVSFRMTELLRNLLPPTLARHTQVRITDPQAQALGQNALLFDSRWLGEAVPAGTPGRVHQRRLLVAGRPWDIRITDHRPVGGVDSNTLWLAAMGLALSASLALMTHTLVRARRLAERRVLRATAALTQEKRYLQESEARYRMLFANSLDAVLRTLPDGTVLAANPAACTLFGRSEAELQGLGRAGLVDTTDPRLALLTSRRTAVGHAQGELRMFKAGGQTFEAEVTSNTYLDGDGRLVASVIVRDVTERRLLAERQARMAAILDATPDFVGSSDLKGHTLFLNRAARRLMGLAMDAPLGRVQATDCHPPWAAKQAVEVGIPTALRDGVWVGRSAVRTADGQELPVSQVILCHRSSRGDITHLSTIARDLSAIEAAAAEREALENRLRETQRLESIGTLAGGVAHDFNNVLAAILGNAAIARDTLPADHPQQRNLGLIHQAAERARTLVQQILTFSRRTPQQLSAQRLQPLLREALSLLRATLPAGVALDVQLTGAPLTVRVDAAQVHQLVLNLCMNAAQALPGQQGTVQVVLALREATAEVPGLAGLVPGTCACLTVRDAGHGMDEATRARIFEPFFTTKPVGQGTGLGLAVVHGIVRSARGAIDVRSAPGQGTEVTVWLPLTEPAPPGADAGPDADGDAAAVPPPVRLLPANNGDGGHAVAPPPSGTEVLYVDDDEVVALTVQALLQRAGHPVTWVETAEQALAHVLQQPGQVRLVISDFNMPGMSGLMLAQALQAQAPGLPVIITSGYVTDELQTAAQAAGVRAVLFKEHTLEQLAPLVAQVLGRSTVG